MSGSIIKLRFVGLLVWLVGIGSISHAQTYCHSETSTPFSFLSSPTVLTGDSVWDDNKYLVPIGFDFLFQGTLYDKLTVETNGRIYLSSILGNNDDPTITIFGGNASELDMIDRGYLLDTALSPISYKLFENPTDTFLIVEYKNVGFYKDQPALSDSISFQLKLYRENGKIEIHIGPHKIIDTSSFYTTGPSIGLGNHSEDNGYFLTGDPASPVVAKYIQPLDTIPDDGMLYTFIPVLPNPTISIVSNPTDGCFDASTNYTFTASVLNENTPSLQWEKNGEAVIGESGNIYNAGLLNLNDTITCVMTLSSACPTALPVTSNRIYVTRPIASISISATDTTICTGSTVLFTATVFNEGNAPIYKWIKNSDTLTTTDPEYLVAGLADQDTVKCLLISNERCVANPTLVSDSIVVTVLPIVSPLVSITANKDSICVGDSVLYTAMPVSGGTSPGYRWTINGSTVGGDSSSIYLTTLNDLDTIRCEITSSLPCATGTALSNPHIIKVRTYTTASVSITSDLTEICAGQAITFTATPVNGGNTPIYSWKNKGVTTGTNNPILSASTFSDGDSVVCIMSSSLFCSNTDTSGFVKLVVHPVLTPSVSILANKDSACLGESILYTATPVNGVGASFQWKVNGNDAGTNSNLFSTSSLANNDAVSCVMTPGSGCYSLSSAFSNSLNTKIVSYVTASVNIVSDATTVCTTTPVNFTASPVNEGSTPTFQWTKNGTPVGTNNPVYNASGFVNGDQISCSLTSSLFCVNDSPTISNSIALNVIASPTSTISVTPSQNPICTGGNITFQATVNGSISPLYQWQINNINVGINSASFTASGFTNNDQVLCKITNGIDCSGGQPTSNVVQVLVNSSADPSITIQPDKNNLCQQDTVIYTANVNGAGISPVYEWKKNGTVVGTNATEYTLIHPANNDLVTCTITTASNCKAISNTLSATVTTCLGTEDAILQKTISIYPNPFRESVSIEFKTISTTTITLIEPTGKEIRRQIIPASSDFKTEWLLGELPYGMYILKITGESTTTLQKLLKQ